MKFGLTSTVLLTSEQKASTTWEARVVESSGKNKRWPLGDLGNDRYSNNENNIPWKYINICMHTYLKGKRKIKRKDIERYASK